MRSTLRAIWLLVPDPFFKALRPGVSWSPPLSRVSSKSALSGQLSTVIDSERSIFLRLPFGENGKHGEIMYHNRQNLPHNV